MKINYFKSGLLSAVMALGCVAMLSSCAENIELNRPIDEGAYTPSMENNVFLRDLNSNLADTPIELFDQSFSTAIKIGLTRAPQSAVSLTIAIDEAYLEKYNAVHGTSHVLYPAASVAFENEGVINIDAKNYQSAKLDVTFTAFADADPAASYAVPVVVTTHGGDVTLKEESKHCIYIIKDMSNEPDCFKGEELPKGYLFFEVNDVNPLNALSFQLENGKYLWDVVVLFAANINYNGTTGRPYIKCNPNVQYLLDNNETLLQPLRKRGIKVLLGLLGNHDMAGLAQLSEIGARDFAREVADYCRTYNLDGVNYDDEYSNYPDLSNPVFAPPSAQAAARLCYETKKAMPEMLVTVFGYGSMYGASSVDGVDADEWTDIVVANYGGTAYPVGNMTKKKCSGISMEFHLGIGGSLNDSRAQSLLSGGYGWYMGFATSPAKYSQNFPRLSGVKTLYGSPLKSPSIFYKKNDPKPYNYPQDL